MQRREKSSHNSDGKKVHKHETVASKLQPKGDVTMALFTRFCIVNASSSGDQEWTGSTKLHGPSYSTNT